MQSSSFNPMENLRVEHQVIADLLALMKEEQQHLIAANAEGVAQVTEQKSKLIAKASDLAKARHAALAQAGFAEREESMQAWLTSVNQSSITQAWEELLAITRSAKEMNRLNGMLINKQLSNTQSALQALHTPAHGTAQNFYGPNGQATAAPTSRRLVVG